MNVDYDRLADDVDSGVFREELKEELLIGFRQIHMTGERLPAGSHYASQIAAIIGNGAATPLSPELAFNVYQEVLAAVESARATVLGEEVKPS
jgi:alkyl hydroperoxide reductase subunit AhpF